MSIVTLYVNIYLLNQSSQRMRDMLPQKIILYHMKCKWKSEWFNKNTVN